MKAASALHALYEAIVNLLAGRLPFRAPDVEEIPHVESRSERQYFVSHIDDYCDCV